MARIALAVAAGALAVLSGSPSRFGIQFTGLSTSAVARFGRWLKPHLRLSPSGARRWLRLQTGEQNSLINSIASFVS
jgi:hypothetical protein